jgi:threonine aldolase
LPAHLREALNAGGWACYEFIGGGLRLMCSWMTTVEDIEALYDCLKTAARLC